MDVAPGGIYEELKARDLSGMTRFMSNQKDLIGNHKDDQMTRLSSVTGLSWGHGETKRYRKWEVGEC